MNERMKKLRKTLGFTQQELANRIGIKRNTIAQYEIGRNEPIDAVISLICREFNVNETWLRTGEGEIFNPVDLEIAEFIKKVMTENKLTFKRKLIGALARLDESEWELLECKLRDIINE